ncbi:MAG: hypothetical protein NTX45_08695 [Proteobacteria bacterium]|nr:hypothetical protein [Pseudomonadota bacterium]
MLGYGALVPNPTYLAKVTYNHMLTMSEWKDIATVIIALCALIIASRNWNSSRQKNLKDATDKIFEEWWHEDTKALRTYFVDEFLSSKLPLLNGCSMKSVEKIVQGDDGRLNRLCYFFDRVGWLAAAGLIDVDYVMAPMQHFMRRLWLTIEPQVMFERQLVPDKTPLFDPVYYKGFEWLFRRSSTWHGHQAFVLYRIGIIRSICQVIKTRRAIQRSESEFIVTLQEKRNVMPQDLNAKP